MTLKAGNDKTRGQRGFGQHLPEGGTASGLQQRHVHPDCQLLRGGVACGGAPWGTVSQPSKKLGMNFQPIFHHEVLQVQPWKGWPADRQEGRAQFLPCAGLIRQCSEFIRSSARPPPPGGGGIIGGPRTMVGGMPVHPRPWCSCTKSPPSRSSACRMAKRLCQGSAEPAPPPSRRFAPSGRGSQIPGGSLRLGFCPVGQRRGA